MSQPTNPKKNGESVDCVRKICLPKKTQPPQEEPDDWEARLAEKPWVIRGHIYTRQGNIRNNED